MSVNPNNFVINGFEEHINFFDKTECLNLMNAALDTRNINELFLSKEMFEKEKKFKGVNPVVGRNLLEKMDTNFIFSSKKFNDKMIQVCGKKYKILNSKFVMGIPKKFIPKWVENELRDTLVSNLGPFVQEKYRDITYFSGIDFHQDIIDHPDRNSDFITVYIYLDKVDRNAAPLYLLQNSHSLGPATFPHKLVKKDTNQYLYKNDFDKEIICDLKELTNVGGTLYYWNCNLLHGTQPQINDVPRISVRILVKKDENDDEICLIDLSNNKINGPLSLSKTRIDLDTQGKGVIRGNFINKNKIFE